MALTKVSSSLVSDNAVTTAKIVDGGIATADIANVAVTTAKIANNAILTQHIDDGQVTTDQLGADAVTAAKIADDAISEEHLDITVITSLTEVTAATGDLLMVADVSDSNNLKKIPVSSILAGTLTNAAQTNITSLGTLTSLNVDTMTLNGSSITGTSNLTLDITGDITLNADGGDWLFYDGAVTLGSIQNDGNNNLVLMSNTNDKDIKFLGIDNSNTITALLLDMSEAGAATFNSTIATGSGGASGKIAIAGNTATSEATHITFTNVQGAKVFAIGGGQSGVTNNGFVIRNVTDNTFPLVISDAGAATFSSSVTATGNYTAGNDASMFIFQRAGGAVSGNIEYNDATTDMEFGTTTAHNFSLKTANTRRLTIDNAGTATFTGTAQATRVGIGVAPHATAGLNITSTAQHVRFNNGSELGIISLESDGALRIWSHGDSSNNEIEFYQGSGSGAASMTIDGSGNVLVGKTNNALANDGVILRAGGELMATNTNDLSGNFNRLGNDGGIISFYKDGAAVGSIGVAASDNIYFAGSSGSTKGIYINNAAVYPANTGGDVINNAVDLGQTGTRWKNIYSSGVVYISDGILNSGAAGSATVFNEDGTTADFRVESDSNEHMLVVNGGTNRVGIGEVSPDRTLHVNGGTTNVVAKFESTDSTAAIEFTDSGGSAEIGNDGSDVVLFPAGTEKFRVQNSTGYLVAQSASQVRLVLGSTGNSSNNTSNWIRGTGSELGLNSGGGNIGMEIGGNLKFQVSTAGQILGNGGAVSTPTFAFIGDSNTGMTRPTGDTLQFVCGGVVKTRISGDGLLFNSDTAAANALDDYEEGTFTPTFSNSNSTAVGKYTKIGNQVTVHYHVVSTGGLPSSGGQVQIGNLPFTSANNGFHGAGALYIGPSNVSSATGGGGTIVPIMEGNATVLRLVNVDTGTLGYTLWGELEVSHNNVVTAIGTFTYTV